MDAMDNEQCVLTQSYPLPASAPSVQYGTRPTDHHTVADHPDAVVTARNEGGVLRAVELEPPRVMRSRRTDDLFDDWESEEEDGEGEDDQGEGEPEGPGTCDGAAVPQTAQHVPGADSMSPGDPTPSDAAEPPPDIDPWASPEYQAGPELADAFTLAVAREQVQSWAAGCGFNVVQKSADQRVGKATFRCSCKGRKFTGGGRNDTLEAGDKRARQTTYALPGESVCPFQ